MTSYKELQAWAQERLPTPSGQPEISVALGSCSLAVGAGEVWEAIAELLEREGLPARLRKTGCPGLCAHEVLLTIAKPGYPSITYRNVTPSSAQELVIDLLSHDRIHPHLALAAKEPWEGIPSWAQIPCWAGQERVLLANCGEIDPDSLEEYLVRGGYGGLNKALSMSPEEVTAEVVRSGLRGRGGAGFPTGRKWEFCRSAPGEARYLICNADESEPGTFKDRLIMEGDPHRVLEGVAIAAYAVGAKEAYIYIRGEYPLAAERLERAIQQTDEVGLLGKGILGSESALEIKLHLGAGAYICGEETALIESLEGKRGVPRLRPPYPPSYGLWGKPTVVNNVETLASLPDIFQKGADWYRGWGTERSPGTKIYTILGDIRQPLAFEAPIGLTVKEAIDSYGGGVKEGRRFGLAQTGGSAGTVVDESKIEVPLDYDSLARSGVSLGSGALLIADESRDIAGFLASVIDFFRVESCGKCTPCREGAVRAYEILEGLVEGLDGQEAVGRLSALAEALRLTSFCGLGTAAAIPLDSALEHFQEELSRQIDVKNGEGLKFNPRQGGDGFASPDEVAEVIARHEREPEALVDTLRDLNSMVGYLPRQALGQVAQEYGLAPSQIYNVASFYSLLSTAPHGEHVIRCCMSPPCYLSGSGEITEALEECLGIEPGETTEDGKFTLEGVSCLGLCGVGPAMTIDDVVYGRLTPEMVGDILEPYRE